MNESGPLRNEIADAVDLFRTSAKVSISRGPDDGTMNCYASLCVNPMRHANTTEMVNNLGSSNASGDYVVFGHGSSGFLETGRGQSGSIEMDNVIVPSNDKVWGPALDSIGHFLGATIYIYSCDTGAESVGAHLLYRMALSLGGRVFARTGFTYCGSNGITFEPGSEWQWASPAGPPTPIPQPPRQGWGESVPVPFSQIQSLSISQQAGNVDVVGEKAELILSACFASAGFAKPGTPAATVTARLTVNARTPGTLLIYNNRIVEHVETGMMHHTLPGIAQLFS